MAHPVWLLGLCLFLGMVTFNAFSMADNAAVEDPDKPYISVIHAHTPEELAGVLERAQAWSLGFETYPKTPIALVLHGAEAQVFVKKNYQQYKKIVDLAAQLDAYNVVDVRICETWMGYRDVDKNELPPFVDTVPFGPAEEARLIEAGYQSF